MSKNKLNLIIILTVLVLALGICVLLYRNTNVKDNTDTTDISTETSSPYTDIAEQSATETEPANSGYRLDTVSIDLAYLYDEETDYISSFNITKEEFSSAYWEHNTTDGRCSSLLYTTHGNFIMIYDLNTKELQITIGL